MKIFKKIIPILFLTGSLFTGHTAEGASQQDREGFHGQRLPVQHSENSDQPEQKNNNPDLATLREAAVAVRAGFAPDPVAVFDRLYPRKTVHPLYELSHLKEILAYIIYGEFYQHLSPKEVNNIIKEFPIIVNEAIREFNMMVFKNSGIKPSVNEESYPEEVKKYVSDWLQTILNKAGVFSLPEQGALEYREFSSEEKSHIFNNFFSNAHFGIGQKVQQIQYPENFKPECLLDSNMISNIGSTAQRIFKNTRQGDMLVAFGSTPFLIYRALTHLVSHDPSDENHRQLVTFPFSGSPNAIRGGMIDKKDRVTPERLLHLRTRMDKAGLILDNMATRTTYFIDMICTGGGLAYVMDEIITVSKEEGKPIPRMATISINEIDRSIDGHSGIARTEATDGQKIRFYFPNHEQPCFAVDNFVVALEGYLILDITPTSPLRIVPPFNPIFWNASYDWLLTQGMSDNQQKLLAHFDNTIRWLKDLEGTGQIWHG
ncbi:MAG: hypothetical protein K0R52_787 [Alphaproteobacteria bacterium]|jgi:hypothetical protein|nr:hypothetical protein [Alphaproteobacteria bacterium]